MFSLMMGEVIVYLLFGNIVIVPVPFGVGTTGFREIYDHLRSKPKRQDYLLAEIHQ